MDMTLPKECLAKLPSTDEVICIRRGESGCHKTDWGKQTDAWIDLKNERIGCSPAQREAMFAGSMFGWDVPGAYSTSLLATGLASSGR